MTERVERTGGTASTGVSSGTKPRALIHRKILDIAAANPDASMEAIADEVSGASITFVERVLEEYGDPAEERPEEQHASGKSSTDTAEAAAETADHGPETTASPQSVDSGAGGDATDERQRETASDGGRQNHAADDGPAVDTASDVDNSGERRVPDGDSTTTADERGDSELSDAATADDAGTVPDTSELSEKQRETLVAVAERPAATQAEIAEELGVSRATISKRLGSVDGFEWPDRATFVDELFEYRGGNTAEQAVAEPVDGSDRIAALESQVEALEVRLDEAASEQTFEPDPELVHKVVHACMDADYISQEEELEVLRDIFQHGTGWP